VITRRQLLTLFILTLMWGINWPMMKLSLREISPLYFRALTMTVGSVVLFIWFRAKGLRMWPQGAEWRSVVVLGLPNMLGWHTISILGELASGRAATLGFTMPIWTVVLGVLFLGEKLTRRAALAAVCVAVAIGLLIAHEFASMAGRPMGIVWMEIAALVWAVGTLMMRRTTLTLPAATLAVWMMILSSACLWVIAASIEPWPVWQFSGLMWVSLAYGAFINYGLAQTLWVDLTLKLPPVTSAMGITAVPLIGTMTATFIVGEWPHWQDFVAIVFVMTAMAAVLLPPHFFRRIKVNA
jgi:drug/metabolite transporter (DMT)-like permease